MTTEPNDDPLVLATMMLDELRSASEIQAAVARSAFVSAIALVEIAKSLRLLTAATAPTGVVNPKTGEIMRTVRVTATNSFA